MRALSGIYLKLLLALLFLFLFYQVCFVNPNKDFDVFVAASKLVFNGSTCYEVWLKSGTAGLKYFYSPLFATLLWPLIHTPQLFNNSVWFLMSLFFLYRTFKLFEFFLPVEQLPATQKRWLYVLAVLSVGRFIFDNLSLGQMTIFLLWGSLESLRLIIEKKYLTGSALLALIINIKILPLTLLFYLAYKKEWQAVLLTVLFSIVFLYLPAVFIGFNFNAQLLHDWLASLTQTTQKSIYEDVSRPGLSSLIPSLLMDTDIQFSTQRNVINLSVASVKLILEASRLLLLLLLAYLFGKPFQSATRKQQVFFDLALICLVTPLIFPHQGKYALLYLLPAYAWCLYTLLVKDVKNTRVVVAFLIVSFVMVTLTTDGLIGTKASDFSQYIHLLTYGVFCLLIAAVSLRPSNVQA